MAVARPLVLVLCLIPAAAAFSGVSSWVPRSKDVGNCKAAETLFAFRPRSVGLKMQEDNSPSNADPTISRRRALQVLGGGVALAAARQYSQGSSYTGSPNLSGKVVVVTGGNTGIGKQTCIRLAAMGAEVVLASRDEQRGRQAEEEVRRLTGSNKVSAMQLDLASLASIERFAARFKSQHKSLDILVNNAGVMALPAREETEDGFERQLGINHLGHFRLTQLLLPELLAAGKAGGDARVVTVSSEAHQLAVGGVDWDDVMARRSYDPWRAYGQSKLANILFTTELERRLPAGSGVSAAALHPGVIQTELGRSFFIPKELCDAAGSVNCKGQLPLWGIALSAPLLLPALLFSRTPPQGAQTQVRVAADPALAGSLGGAYFSDCKKAAPSAAAQDAEAARRLWELSLQLTGSTTL